MMRNPEFVAKAASPRIPIQKTYKLYVGGKFIRSESGRVAPALGSDDKVLANYSRASRKDFRDAAVAARTAFGGWAKQSAYLRGQILYRAAEMLEMRQNELREELSRANGVRRSAGNDETTLAIDRL